MNYKMQKILVITSTYPRHSKDYAVPWMHELHQRLLKRSHQLTVLAPSYRGLRSHVVDGVEVQRFRYAPAGLETLTHEEGASYRVRNPWMQLLAIPYIIAGCIAAARLARRGDYDIIHVHWPFPHGLMGQAARWFGGGKLVVMSHGAEFALAKRKKWIEPILRQSLRAADLRIANSKSTAKSVEKCSKQFCRVLPYGTTVRPLPAPKTINEVPRILFTGRLIERKGLKYLLKAVPSVLRHGKAKFIITGDGDQRQSLMELRDSLGIQDAVEFLGFVSKEDLAREYARCDIWVNPGIVDSWGDAEGLGVGSIEAYSYFKPVIASDVGGISDTIVNGVTGYLVPPARSEELATAILTLLSDPAKRDSFGEAGFRFASKKFSWSRIIDELEDDYMQVTRPPREDRTNVGDGYAEAA